MSIRDGGMFSDQVIAAMREVAESIILPRFNQLAAHDIRSKTHPADLVTIADEESERALEKRLSALLPGSLLIGEEAVAADPNVLERIHTDEPVWIIDPIDGTANFVNGVARFAVMIALARKGETIMGWIHEPLESRTLFAEAGGGTWHTSRENVRERMHIAAVAEQLGAMVAGIYNRDMAHIKGKFARIVRLGSAAHDYWSLVDGRMQVLCYRRLKPWDHAAGILIHSEAGGYNRLFSGAAYRPSGRDQMGLLCTPTEEIWREVMALGPTMAA